MTTLQRGMTAEEFTTWMHTVSKLKSLTDVGMRDGVDGDLCIDQVGAAAKACPESLVHLFHEGSSTGARAKLAQLVGVGRLDREVNHPTAAPAVPWACFGPFCGALRDILRIYGFEGDATLGRSNQHFSDLTSPNQAPRSRLRLYVRLSARA